MHINRDKQNGLKRKQKELERDDKNYVKMNNANLKEICLQNNQYEFPELNEKLYLHFKGFIKIENLEEYDNVKTLWLECNCLYKIENLSPLINLNSLFL
jgi:hypothetical protein